MKIIGLKEVQEMLGCSRGMAEYILGQKDCPLINKGRVKGQHYKIFDEDLIEWLKRKVWK